jgi:hypothetical protein
MKKYYSLVLFVVFVLVAGAIFLGGGKKENVTVKEQTVQPADNSTVGNDVSSAPVDAVESAPEYVDLENVEVDFEQDITETEDILDDYSEFEGNIEVDSIDENVL